MIAPDANKMVVDTEDAVSFSLTLATPISRALALIIDLGAVAVIQMIIDLALFIPSTFLRDFATGIAIALYFIVGIGYFMLLEYTWNGQTFGKRLMKIRVVDAHIQRLTGYQIVLRNLFRVVDMLPIFYTLGGIVSLCNAKYQRLGDIAASTIVVRSRPEAAPALPKDITNKYNSFQRYPQIEAILKRNSLPEEHHVALQCLLRRDELEPAARIQVFDQLARHFQQKAKFPAEIVHDLTDEQYVRNCVDSIYRKR